MNSSVFGSDSQPGLTLLATGRQDCSDLHSWGPGVRPVYIIHYILRGQGFIEYHKKTFPVHTGESFLIYPYDTIRYYPDPGNPWEYTWVEFTGKEAASLLDQTAFSPAAPVCPSDLPCPAPTAFCRSAAPRPLSPEPQRSKWHTPHAARSLCRLCPGTRSARLSCFVPSGKCSFSDPLQFSS